MADFVYNVGTLPTNDGNTYEGIIFGKTAATSKLMLNLVAYDGGVDANGAAEIPQAANILRSVIIVSSEGSTDIPSFPSGEYPVVAATGSRGFNPTNYSPATISAQGASSTIYTPTITPVSLDIFSLTEGTIKALRVKGPALSSTGAGFICRNIKITGTANAKAASRVPRIEVAPSYDVLRFDLTAEDAKMLTNLESVSIGTNLRAACVYTSNAIALECDRPPADTNTEALRYRIFQTDTASALAHKAVYRGGIPTTGIVKYVSLDAACEKSKLSHYLPVRFYDSKGDTQYLSVATVLQDTDAANMNNPSKRYDGAYVNGAWERGLDYDSPTIIDGFYHIWKKPFEAYLESTFEADAFAYARSAQAGAGVSSSGTSEWYLVRGRTFDASSAIRIDATGGSIRLGGVMNTMTSTGESTTTVALGYRLALKATDANGLYGGCVTVVSDDALWAYARKSLSWVGPENYPYPTEELTPTYGSYRFGLDAVGADVRYKWSFSNMETQESDTLVVTKDMIGLTITLEAYDANGVLLKSPPVLVGTVRKIDIGNTISLAGDALVGEDVRGLVSGLREGADPRYAFRLYGATYHEPIATAQDGASDVYTVGDASEGYRMRVECYDASGNFSTITSSLSVVVVKPRVGGYFLLDGEPDVGHAITAELRDVDATDIVVELVAYSDIALTLEEVLPTSTVAEYTYRHECIDGDRRYHLARWRATSPSLSGAIYSDWMRICDAEGGSIVDGLATASQRGLVEVDAVWTSPSVRTKYVTAEGRSGDIDMTDAVTGFPVYGSGTIEFEWSAVSDGENDIEGAVAEAINTLNGRRVRIVLDRWRHRLGYTYGRLVFDKPEFDFLDATVKAKATCDSFIYKEVDYTEELTIPSIDTATLATLDSGAAPVVPYVDVSAISKQITGEDKSVTVKASCNGSTVTFKGDSVIELDGLIVYGKTPITIEISGVEEMAYYVVTVGCKVGDLYV